MRDEKPRRSLMALARAAARPAVRRFGGRIQGFVDALVNGDMVVGWARDVKDTTRRLEIQLLHDGEVVGFGIADLVRKDLQEQGIGDGKYGFRLRLAPALLDGTPRTIVVCAVTERGKVPLQRGTLSLSPGQEGAGGREPRASGSMVGALERITGNALHGWAFNPDQPDAPALVDVYDDERYLGSVTADRSRPRLYEKGYPSGARGFVFELPADVAPGAAGRLRARVAGTAHDLRRARDFASKAQAPTAHDAAAMPPPPKADAPHPGRQPVAARAALPDAGVPTIGLLVVPGPGALEDTVGDWAAQRHDAVLLVGRAAVAGLPERLARDLVALGDKAAMERTRRETSFLVTGAAGTRLDPDLAGALALPVPFPDVVVIDGTRPSLSGEAARVETFLAPARIPTLAIRSDVLGGYPGNLRRDLDEGLLSPVLLWLAGRSDLVWTTLPAPGSVRGTEAAADRRPRLWRGVLDEQEWAVEADGLRPRRAPERISIALWRGWDVPGLPTLQALAQGASTPLDILVPAERDEARGAARLAAAEAAIAGTGARARIIDCPPGDLPVIRAMLAAADGEAILLSDGAAAVTPDMLERLARWCLHPALGAVGPSGAVLIEGPALRPARDCGVVDVVPFGCLMIAAAHLAAAGGPDGGADALDGAALLWARRLARHGFHPATISGDGPCPDAPSGPLPWPVRARLRADGLLDA